MEILSKLPERLKELMFDKGINAPTLAKVLGLNSTAITRYLQGVRLPKFESFIALVEYFDCSADYLLGLVDFPHPQQSFNPTPPFASQFRAAMEKCGVSQYALQKKTGITWSNFHKWLNGNALPYVDSLIKLAQGLDCSVDELLGREN